jgi:FdhD protein
MTDSPPRQPVVERRVTSADSDMQAWGIAVETPVEIGINGAPWTVMMATPTDLEDLAIGLALTERVVSDINAVERITVSNYLEGIVVDLTVPLHAVNESARNRRSLEGRIGCGLCGVEALAGLPSRPTDRWQTNFGDRRGCTALQDQSALQPLNLATHSVHAAVWCRRWSHRPRTRRRRPPQRARQLIGALSVQVRSKSRVHRDDESLQFRVGVQGGDARGRAGTISAPTSLALEWAEMLDLLLMCRGASDSIAAVPGG